MKRNKNKKYLVYGLGSIFLLMLFCGAALAAGSATITGIVSDGYQIVTDDEVVYELGDNEKADEIMQHVGLKVRVTGMVEESEDAKVITITSYEVLEE